MTTITYTAKRDIASGHTAGTNYTIEFGAEKLARSQKVIRHQNASLGQLRETVYLGRDQYWDVTTDFIDESDLPFWREWFASVAGGELFAFDAYGTIAVPDNQENVLLDTETYRESRVGMLRTYRIDFRVIF